MQPPATTTTPVTNKPQITTEGGDKSTDLNKIEGNRDDDNEGTALIIGPVVGVFLLITLIVLRKSYCI